MTILFDNKDIIKLDSHWINPTHRKYEDREYYSVTLTDSHEFFVTLLLSWFEKQSGIILKNYNMHLILHRFYEGNFFTRHKDNIFIYNKNRAYVVGFHLNNDYDGGSYILHDNDNTIVIDIKEELKKYKSKNFLIMSYEDLYYRNKIKTLIDYINLPELYDLKFPYGKKYRIFKSII